MACRLIRLVKMIKLIRGMYFPNVNQLCNVFQIKERTLFNDLKELREELGVEILFDKARGGYSINGDVAELNFFSLNEESVLLLLSAFCMLKACGGAELIEALQSNLQEEIAYCLNDPHYQRDFSDVFQNENIQSISKNIFVQLCRACIKMQTVQISTTSSLPTLTEIKPRYLIFCSDGWKVAFENGDGGIKQMSLSAISALHLPGADDR